MLGILRLMPALLAVNVLANEAIEQITITAPDAHHEFNDSAEPITRLNAEQLAKLSGASIGEILAQTPGVKNSSYGSGVGRPVIRGMSNNRVQIFNNDIDTSDVSAMSSDHSPMVDINQATQVDIIQGPKSLLYSGSAIAGVINVQDDSIHRQAFTDFYGGATLAKLSSVDRGWQHKAAINGSTEQWAAHLSGFNQKSNDYRAHVGKRSSVKIQNSDTRSYGGSAGLSFFPTADSYIGFAIQSLDNQYAVPNDDNESLRVTPKQTHYALKAGGQHSNDWLDAWQLDVSYIDYQHKEIEDDVTEAYFKKQTWQLRNILAYTINDSWSAQSGWQLSYKELGLCHDHDGCSGVPRYRGWDGSKGADLVALGGYDFSHETPMAKSKTTTLGVFSVKEWFWHAGKLELGARVDRQHIRLDPSNIETDTRQAKRYYRSLDFTPINISLAHTWFLTDAHQLGLSLARKQRAPEVEELFWNGAHHATFIYQLDNPDLDTETAYTSNLSWQFTGAVNSRVDVFYYDFRDLIYNQRLAIADPFHNDDVYRFAQHAARFYGAEAVLNIPLDGLLPHLALDVVADVVRAELKQSNNKHLPRTPPASLGFALHWQNQQWFAQLDSRAYAAQNKTALNEAATSGYATLNAQVAWSYQMLRLSLKANNLTNQAGFNHVSYLKRQAPIAGRNFIAELAVQF